MRYRLNLYSNFAVRYTYLFETADIEVVLRRFSARHLYRLSIVDSPYNADALPRCWSIISASKDVRFKYNGLLLPKQILEWIESHIFEIRLSQFSESLFIKWFRILIVVFDSFFRKMKTMRRFLKFMRRNGIPFRTH